MPFYDNRGSTAVQNRPRVTYDHLREQREGEAHMFFAGWAIHVRVFYAAPERVKALRVHRFLPVPASTTSTAARERTMGEMIGHVKDPDGKAASAAPNVPVSGEIAALAKNLAAATAAGQGAVAAGVVAVMGLSKVEARASAAKGGEALPVPAKAGGRTAAAPATAGKAAAQGKVSAPGALLEGDEYAIDEMDHFSGAAAKGSNGTQGSAARAVAASGGNGTSGFRATDLDVNVVMRPGEEAESFDVTSIRLPDDMAALLAESAQRLNEGLASGG